MRLLVFALEATPILEAFSDGEWNCRFSKLA